MQNIMDELTSRIYIGEKTRKTCTQKKLKPRNLSKLNAKCKALMSLIALYKWNYYEEE